MQRTPIRLLGAVSVAMVLAFGVVATPAAASMASPIPISAWQGGQSSDGTTWTPYPGCSSGVVPGPPQVAYRCAFEFSLASLPAAATVVAANVRLYTDQGYVSVDLGGYSGDGSANLADLTAGTTILTFTPHSGIWQDWDVTTFLQGLVSAHAGWAGFTLSGTALPPGWDVSHFTLNVGYTVPGDTGPLPVNSWQGGFSTDGTNWSGYSDCDAGAMPGPVTRAYRCAFEFSLESVPSGATVTGASLRMLTGQGGEPVDLGGYAGDGAATLADLTAGSRILTFTPAYNSWQDWDVTAFVGSLVTSHAAWAGFNISGTGMGQWFDGAHFTLNVTYVASQATPPPTSAEAGPSESSGPITAELIAVLLIATAATLVVRRRAFARH